MGETAGLGRTACWREGQGRAGWEGRGGRGGLQALPGIERSPKPLPHCSGGISVWPVLVAGSVRAGRPGEVAGREAPESVLLEPGASAGLDCFPVCPLMQNSCNSFI